MGTEAEEAAKALEEEINDLDKVGDEEVPPVPDKEEPPSVPSTKEEPPESAPVVPTGEPAVEPTVTPAPAVTPPKEETAEDRYNALLGKFNELSREILELKGKPPAESKPTEPAKTTPTEPTVPAAVPEEDFIGDLDMDDVTADPKVLNKVLNNLKRSILESFKVEEIIDKASQKTLLGIPTVVQSQIRQQASFDALVNEFYDTNKDLANVKETVGMVANNIAAEHPDWTVAQVFKESAVRTRALLKLPVPKIEDPVVQDLDPALPGKTTTKSKIKDIRSALQREIDEL